MLIALFLLVSFSILIYIFYKYYTKPTKDNYTSAQPPPPLSNVVTHYERPIVGIDCTSDCPPNAYYGYPRYPIYSYDTGYGNRNTIYNEEDSHHEERNNREEEHHGESLYGHKDGHGSLYGRDGHGSLYGHKDGHGSLYGHKDGHGSLYGRDGHL